MEVNHVVQGWGERCNSLSVSDETPYDQCLIGIPSVQTILLSSLLLFLSLLPLVLAELGLQSESVVPLHLHLNDVLRRETLIPQLRNLL
jgi:hypothetical protein